MRLNQWFSVITSALTLFFFLSTWYIVPSAHAAGEAAKADRARKQYHPRGRSDEEKLSNTLQDIKERVAQRRAQVHKRVKEESDLWQGFLNLFGMSRLAKENLDRLDAMADQAELLNQKSLQGFDAVEKELIDKGLPEEILQRHHATMEKYKTEYRRFREKLQNAQSAQSLQDQDSALGDLDEFMGKQQFKRRQQPFDPDKLPFGTPDPKKTREPVTDPQELDRLLGLNTEPGLIEKVADALSTPAYADPVAGPTPADLAETIDVQMTDAIKDMAAQLNHHPVEIYNWVRNNIDFMPTYGSIQGSDMTLQSKRGNAFDTASLLIALLRASNIPAKYAYGTIRVPVDKVMNWVGGAEVPAAAMHVLSQGGIPNIGITSGGQVEFIKMEHIWVEAWVDFEPSRGAINIQGDSWVPLDASFKQYEYTDGIDIQSQVPFDTQYFMDMSGTTIDEDTGSIQNIDQQFIKDYLVQYHEDIQEYIDTQVPSGATVQDLFGGKTIQVSNLTVLPTGLPYELLQVTAGFAEIPSNLRHKYRITLKDQYGWDVSSRTLDLPAIAGSTLALSFSPATAADEQTLQRFFPDDLTDISQLPSILPAYLIKLKPVLVIDNTEQAFGGIIQMGEEITLNQALYSPQFGMEGTDSIIVAGEYHAIGVSGAGMEASMLERLRNQMLDVQAIVADCRDNQNCGPAEQLNKHQYLGAILQTGILGWFLQVQHQDRLVAPSQQIVYHPLPSYGKFGTSANIQYSWGIPRNISFPGVIMDIDFNRLLIEAENADLQSKINFARQSGILGSIMEHRVPEDIFSTTAEPSYGISAVKAIGIAAAQGQRIFALSQENMEQLSSVGLDTDTRTEIQGALLAGKEVAVHENHIDAFGWSGTGYYILDPETGSGAYKISGGANGGSLTGEKAGSFATALASTLGVPPSMLLASPNHCTFLECFKKHLFDVQWLNWIGLIGGIFGVCAFLALISGAGAGPVALACGIIGGVLALFYVQWALFTAVDCLFWPDCT